MYKKNPGEKASRKKQNKSHINAENPPPQVPMVNGNWMLGDEEGRKIRFFFQLSSGVNTADPRHGRGLQSILDPRPCSIRRTFLPEQRALRRRILPPLFSVNNLGH
ncbi:hypothetical protein AVEN_239849-1 [Araneus ventricosus]|uniref:Uncharacterized protein n=1 Tax=Araneus ventricosus TaxID=182803 RepID=A0A4Y2H6W6_ARAVE|nr:hypothetical protein AVEN_239849-1 [Araneus ventricosus]